MFRRPTAEIETVRLPIFKLSTSLDMSGAPSYSVLVTAKDLRRLFRSLGCVDTRRHGSHLPVECGQCVTTCRCTARTSGLLRRIERDLETCLRKGWLREP